MTLPQKQYNELLALTKQYLLQDHDLKERLYADPATYTYFRNLVIKKRVATVFTPTSSQKQVQKVKPSPIVPKEMETKKTPISVKQESVAPPKPTETPKETATSTKKIATDAPLEHPLIKKASEGPSQSSFALAPTTTADPVDVDEIRKILRERLPALTLLDTIPCDAEARKMARAWEMNLSTPILILSFNADTKQRSFLENLRFAIEVNGTSATIVQGVEIEKNKGWDALLKSEHLRLIIALSLDIDACTHLKKCRQEKGNPLESFLGKVPLLTLTNPDAYLQDPTLKPLLWNSLKALLSSSL